MGAGGWLKRGLGYYHFYVFAIFCYKQLSWKDDWEKVLRHHDSLLSSVTCLSLKGGKSWPPEKRIRGSRGRKRWENKTGRGKGGAARHQPAPSPPARFLQPYLDILPNTDLFFNLCIYLFMPALGLRRCTRAFSGCREQGYSVEVHGPLTPAVSLVVAHKLQSASSLVLAPGVSCSAGMWDHPQSGMELQSPALQGRFLTTRHQRSPDTDFSNQLSVLSRPSPLALRLMLPWGSCRPKKSMCPSTALSPFQHPG